MKTALFITTLTLVFAATLSTVASASEMPTPTKVFTEIGANSPKYINTFSSEQWRMIGDELLSKGNHQAYQEVASTCAAAPKFDACVTNYLRMQYAAAKAKRERELNRQLSLNASNQRQTFSVGPR